MADSIQYALMAGASYISTRSDINKFPVPEGWTPVIDPPHFKDDVTGFEAISFTNGGEVVISFAGTNNDPPITLFNPDRQASVALALGSLSAQLKQAADYYLAVRASVPEGTKITLTGHSLGAGLASLIAVFFNETAVTFDQAPFRQPKGSESFDFLSD